MFEKNYFFTFIFKYFAENTIKYFSKTSFNPTNGRGQLFNYYQTLVFFFLREADFQMLS